MFTTKKKSLVKAKETPAKQSVKGATPFGTKNKFVMAGMGGSNSNVIASQNGAKKFSTSGNIFVDQFGKAGEYKKPRTYAEISADMEKLWAFSPNITMRFLFYLRIITRVVQLHDGNRTTSPQRGLGLKHEGIFRMMWVAVNHPKEFWENIALFITAGSWKDIVTMLSYDLQYNGWDDRKLNWNNFGNLLLAGLENENTSNLVKKYLPQIRANSKAKTLEAQADSMIGKWIASLLFGSKKSESYTYAQYRRLKSSGNAHEWQQLISQKKLLKIDFSKVHGRALAQLVSGKFLKNNKLETIYGAWLEKQPVVKYTGYVYELMATVAQATTLIKADTINKQFKMLVDTAKKGAKTGTSLIVVRDVSGSMGSAAAGTKVTCFDVAKSLALFFSEMLPDGYFANSYIEFASDAQMVQWKGATPVEKWKNDHRSYYGSTDFQSVIRLFAKIKKQGVPEKEFPTGILCISDGEFNPAQLGKTNVEAARGVLKAAGFSAKFCEDFQIILWNVANNYRTSGNKFETNTGGVKNVFYISGLDGSVIAFLTGLEKDKDKKAPSTPEELFDAAMDQEILDMIRA